jgi:hypothetical protein
LKNLILPLKYIVGFPSLFLIDPVFLCGCESFSIRFLGQFVGAGLIWFLVHVACEFILGPLKQTHAKAFSFSTDFFAVARVLPLSFLVRSTSTLHRRGGRPSPCAQEHCRQGGLRSFSSCAWIRLPDGVLHRLVRRWNSPAGG